MLNETSRHSLYIRFQAVFLFLLMPFQIGGWYLFAVLLASDLIFILMYGGMREIKVRFLEIAWVMYFAGWLMISPTFEGIQRMVQLLILMLTYYINRYMTRCGKRDYIFIGMTAVVSVFAFIVQWGRTGFSFVRIITLGGASNAFFITIVMVNVICTILGWKPLKNKYSLLFYSIVFVSIVLLYFTRNRTAIGSVLLYFAFLKFFNHFDNSKVKSIYTYAVISMFILMLFFTYIYSLLGYASIGNDLQDLSFRYFHKNFYSGRQEIWPALINAIAIKPICGYGLHIQPSNLTPFTLSAHNIYLQTLIQSGIIGLFLLSAFVYRIVEDMKGSVIASAGIAYICTTIFRESFGEFITQVAFIYGCVTWMIWGIIANARRR